MKAEALSLLRSEQAQWLIREHLQADPPSLAYSLRKSHPAFAALVATQVALLQRAKEKLPSYYKAQALLTREALEQASSEQAAILKNTTLGELAIDFTAGLGVDCLALSHNYSRVIALERQEGLAEMTKENLNVRLKRENITVVHADATEWIAGYSGPKADVIFLDPSRRTAAKPKAIALADMEPNLMELLPLVRKNARLIRVKLSPLFDLQEGFRVFGMANARVISLSGECKEVVFEFGEAVTVPTVEVATISNHGSSQLSLPLFEVGNYSLPHTPEKLSAFLYEPDVAYYKAGLVEAIAKINFTDLEVWLTGKPGYLLSDFLHPTFPGRAFSVVAQMPYQPRQVSKYLADKQIDCANIARKGFPETVDVIRKRLSLKEGGKDYLFFAGVPGNYYCYHTRQA